MQLPGSALIQLHHKQQNLHANVTQKSVKKKPIQKKSLSAKEIRRGNNILRTPKNFKQR